VNIGYDALSREFFETQALTTPPRSLQYQYDLAGNRTQISWPDAAPNALSVDYVYDYLNRVTAIEENGATSGPGLLATYTYNPASQLAVNNVSNDAYSHHPGPLHSGDFLAAEYDASGNVVGRYVPGPAADEPVVWCSGAGVSNRRWLRADALAH